MKLYQIGALLLTGGMGILPSLSNAQYCTPTVATTGIYFSYIDFGISNSGFTGGVTHTSGSSGYSNTATTSGTVKRYFGGSVYYGVYNPTSAPISFQIGVFTDWNNDHDFNDAGEQNNYLIGNTDPAMNSQTTGTSVIPPLNMSSGNFRFRMAVTQSGTTTPDPCGTFTGEVEDYAITVATNTAPVLNSANAPLMNTLLTSQTNSDGFSLSELIEYFATGTNMITDADDNPSNSFYSKMPRGVAIYGQTATNGTWQYKIGTGAWTNIGTVSTTNALLLLSNASDGGYQANDRLRFVPTGTGTPTLSFKAWDGTNADNGTYGTTTTTGGTSAFSTANNTASLPVIAGTTYSDNIYVSTADGITYKGAFDRTNKAIANTDTLISGDINYGGIDMELQSGTNKLFWVDQYYTDIYTANLDGSGVQPIISGLNSCTGIAIGNNRLYYMGYNADYSSSIIYKANTNGTGATAIYTTTGFADARDIDYYKGKIYFEYSNGTNYVISSIDTVGAGFTSLVSDTVTMSGLTVKNDTIYWGANYTPLTAYVKKKAIAGGSITIVASETGRNIYDLMIDSTSSTIYFTDGDASGNSFYTLLRKVSTTGTGLGTAATLTGTGLSLVFNNIPTTPLPISLLDFSGNYDAVNSVALLNWTTASEPPNVTFELERSIDGSHFDAITTVKGKGSNAQGFSYSYSDDVKAIDAQTIFYRLKEVKTDASFEYSKVFALNKKQQTSDINLWPNPSKGIFNIQLKSADAVSIKVYSNDGRLILSDKISNANIYQLNLSNKPSGLYFVQIGFANGTQKQMTVSKE